MTSVWAWSRTAASNSNADSGINWAEGQLPSTVNNSARAMMSRVAELIYDLGGLGTVGGTANGITLTAASGFSAYRSGLIVAVSPSSTNTGAVTLNVNGIGAKAVKKFTTTGGQVDVLANEMRAGGLYILVYNTGLDSGSGGWILTNPSQFDPTGALTAAQTIIEGSTPLIRLTDTDSGADNYVSASNGTGSITIEADANNEVAGSFVRIDVDGTEVARFRGAGGVTTIQPVYDNTTASSVNVNVASNGTLARSTSALKYKANVADLTDEDVDRFLSLRGVSYTSLCPNDDADMTHFGIVADEAHEAGLTELVVYGADGAVEGFKYDRGVAVLLEIVKRQQARLAALEAN